MNTGGLVQSRETSFVIFAFFRVVGPDVTQVVLRKSLNGRFDVSVIDTEQTLRHRH